MEAWNPLLLPHTTCSHITGGAVWESEWVSYTHSVVNCLGADPHQIFLCQRLYSTKPPSRPWRRMLLLKDFWNRTWSPTNVFGSGFSHIITWHKISWTTSIYILNNKWACSHIGFDKNLNQYQFIWNHTCVSHPSSVLQSSIPFQHVYILNFLKIKITPN